MTLSRKALSDWYWAGGPGRRLVASLLITVIVVFLPIVGGWKSAVSLIPFFVGWDFGAWFMDNVYVHRLSRRTLGSE